MKTERSFLPKDCDSEQEARKKLKKDSQKKWKEIWDAETRFSQIKHAIDYKRKDLVPLKQFSPSKKLAMPLEVVSPYRTLEPTRGCSLPRAASRVSGKDMFLTGNEQPGMSREAGTRRNSQPLKFETVSKQNSKGI